MNFWVATKTVTNAGLKYDVFDGTAPAGTVTVNFHKKRSFWRVQGNNGLLIADESTRRAMYKAVRRYDAA